MEQISFQAHLTNLNATLINFISLFEKTKSLCFTVTVEIVVFIIELKVVEEEGEDKLLKVRLHSNYSSMIMEFVDFPSLEYNQDSDLTEYSCKMINFQNAEHFINLEDQKANYITSSY